LKSPPEAPQSELGVGENFGVGGAFAKWGAAGSPGEARRGLRDVARIAMKNADSMVSARNEENNMDLSD
jgi:hypothetical protein